MTTGHINLLFSFLQSLDPVEQRHSKVIDIHRNSFQDYTFWQLPKESVQTHTHQPV